MTIASISTGVLRDLYGVAGRANPEQQRRLGGSRLHQAVRGLDLGRVLVYGVWRNTCLTDRRYRIHAANKSDNTEEGLATDKQTELAVEGKTL